MIVRVGLLWSFVVRCGHVGSENQPEVAYCIFNLNYYFLINKWPFFKLFSKKILFCFSLGSDLNI